MALTAQQKIILKKMINERFRRSPSTTVDLLVDTLLTATQQENAYDFLRNEIIAAIDAEKTNLSDLSTDLESSKSIWPSRV